MTGTDFIVPARSWDAIAEVANNLRTQLGIREQPDFPIMTLLEKIMDAQGLMTLLVSPQAEMGNAEGYTCPDGSYIELREDVYNLAWRGDGRARFTAAHELGHFLLHSRLPLARATGPAEIPPFKRSEPQANQFAAEVLMPRSFAMILDTEDDLVNRHNVSWSAAQKRLDFFHKKGLV